MVVDLRLITKLLGSSLFWLGIIATVPALYALITKTPGLWEFAITAAVGTAIGALLHLIGRNAGKNATLRELFLFTGVLWLCMTLLGIIPFYTILPDLNFASAFFESASALSTTGSTVITALDTRPPAILLWRSILQYLGGIGFVVIGVAILPNIAMGGMALFKTESTSFDGSSKNTPHIKTMALGLLSWYVLNAVLCSFFYYLGGFEPFLAINSALCTVSTGGMMPIDASMNEASPFIHYTAMVFMFLGSCPFLLILRALADDFFDFFRDEQVRYYLIFIVVISISIAITLIQINHYDIEKAFRVAFFNVIAVLSSTCFGLDDFSQWNPFATIVFTIILGIGGCSGSTAGGIKVFRLAVCFSLFKTEIVKSLHPHAMVEPRYNNRIIDSNTMRAIITYLVAYIMVTVASSVIAASYGLEPGDAFTFTVSSLSNIGQGMGPTINPSISSVDLRDELYYLFGLDMLLGRLEVLPVLLCFTRSFWRR
jgi:trk system potassium uptake protein TrkH